MGGAVWASTYTEVLYCASQNNSADGRVLDFHHKSSTLMLSFGTGDTNYDVHTYNSKLRNSL